MSVLLANVTIRRQLTIVPVNRKFPARTWVGPTATGAGPSGSSWPERSGPRGPSRQGRILRSASSGPHPQCRFVWAVSSGPWSQLRALAQQHVTTHADLGALVRAGLAALRSEEHTSELQSRGQLVCRLLLENKKD